MPKTHLGALLVGLPILIWLPVNAQTGKTDDIARLLRITGIYSLIERQVDVILDGTAAKMIELMVKKAEARARKMPTEFNAILVEEMRGELRSSLPLPID